MSNAPERDNVAGIQIERAFKVARRLLPATLPTVDVAAQLEDSRVVRQSAVCNTNFGACAVIVEITVKMLRQGKVRVARIRSQPQGVFNCRVRQGETARGVVESEEVEIVVRASQLAIGEQACGIAADGLVEEIHGLEELLLHGPAAGNSVDQCRGPNVKIEGREISSGSLFERGLFRGREPGLKLVGDCLGNFALNGKNIRKLSVIGLRPQM